MTAARVGVAVRALLIAAVGMSIGYLMPKDPPAVNILVYYGVFFLLTIPFLHLRPVTLVMCAMLFGVVAPVLMQILRGRLPEFTAYNPTFNDVVTVPGATAAQLLLTGTYPALPYMTYLLTGGQVASATGGGEAHQVHGRADLGQFLVLQQEQALVGGQQDHPGGRVPGDGVHVGDGGAAVVAGRGRGLRLW